MEPLILDPPRARLVPIVASVPHSGTYVPPEIVERLNPRFRHLPDTDWHVDRLFDFLPDLGVAVVRGTHSRYVADPNRPIREPLYGPFSRSVVAAASFAGEPLYRTPPTEAEVRGRIARVHTPYHEAIRTLLDDRVARFGRAYLVDLHSFDTVIDDDVDLGDDHGRMGADTLLPALAEALGDRFTVVRNKAWPGGHISRLCAGLDGVEAVQVEANHAAYLHEDELGGSSPPTWEHAKFRDARTRFRAAFEEIVERLA